jgi:hypothetical protein
MSGGVEGREGDSADEFAGWWDRMEAELISRLQITAMDESDWRTKLRVAVWEAARLAEAHPELARYFTVETMARGREGQERQRRLVEHLTTRVDRWRSESGATVEPGSSRWALGVLYAGFYRHIASGREAELTAEVPGLMFLALSPYCGVESALAELNRRPPH